MSLALKVDENQVIQAVRLVTLVKVMNSVLSKLTVLLSSKFWIYQLS